MHNIDNTPDENPFVVLKEMDKKRDQILESFSELREFMDNFTNMIQRSGMAPMAASQFTALKMQGLKLLEELLSEELRQAMQEQDSKVQMHNVIDSAKKSDD